MKRIGLLMVLVGMLLMSSLVAAGPTVVTVDGVRENSEGYATLAVQDTQTQFGDNSDDSVDKAGGSEIDGLYLVDSGDFIYLMVTGNLESNFNKLEIFIDNSSAAGQNTLANNPDSGILTSMEGLTFDSGFTADALIAFTTGNDPTEVYLDYVAIPTGGGGQQTFVGGGPGLTIDGETPDIDVALNNSNTAGVEGGDGLATGDAAAVTTGIEFKIEKAAFGVSTSRAADIKVMAFVNGQGHDFVSNQVIPGIGGGGNLGAPSGVNFDNIAGTQFAQVSVTSVGLVEQSSSAASFGLVWIAAGLALLTVGSLRRRAF